MITEQQFDLLKQFTDKNYIDAILDELSCNHYSLVKNIMNIPLILSDTIMVIMNSIIDN